MYSECLVTRKTSLKLVKGTRIVVKFNTGEFKMKTRSIDVLLKMLVRLEFSWTHKNAMIESSSFMNF